MTSSRWVPESMRTFSKYMRYPRTSVSSRSNSWPLNTRTARAVASATLPSCSPDKPVQPFQSALDVGFGETRLVQFEFQDTAIRPRLVVGAHVILEEIDE